MGLTTLPPSCADCLEIWNPQVLSRPVMGLLYLYLYLYIYIYLFMCSMLCMYYILLINPLDLDYIRYDILTAAKVNFWLTYVAPHCVVRRFQPFEEICCLHLKYARIGESVTCLYVF